jgi:hypothetical protein
LAPGVAVFGVSVNVLVTCCQIVYSSILTAESKLLLLLEVFLAFCLIVTMINYLN